MNAVEIEPRKGKLITEARRNHLTYHQGQSLLYISKLSMMTSTGIDVETLLGIMMIGDIVTILAGNKLTMTWCALVETT